MSCFNLASGGVGWGLFGRREDEKAHKRSLVDGEPVSLARLADTDTDVYSDGVEDPGLATVEDRAEAGSNKDCSCDE